MKKLCKLLTLLIFIGLIIIIITGINIYSFGKNSVPQKSDCIIVLGCRLYSDDPSPFLQGRLDKGIELYNKGYGKYIIVSGGKGQGESISEAAAMKKYLSEKGIPSDKIICEDKSVSTMTNIINSTDIMKYMGLRSAVIVSNKYHLKRASLMAKKCGIIPYVDGVYMNKYPFQEAAGFLREIAALWKFLILGN